VCDDALCGQQIAFGAAAQPLHQQDRIEFFRHRIAKRPGFTPRPEGIDDGKELLTRQRQLIARRTASTAGQAFLDDPRALQQLQPAREQRPRDARQAAFQIIKVGRAG
jgi:hypothetical protein